MNDFKYTIGDIVNVIYIIDGLQQLLKCKIVCKFKSNDIDTYDMITLEDYDFGNVYCGTAGELRASITEKHILLIKSKQNKSKDKVGDSNSVESAQDYFRRMMAI